MPVAPYPVPQAPYNGFEDPHGIPAHLDVRISVLVDRDAAVAKAELNATGQPYATPLARSTGSAKRHQDDVPDEEIATLYAASRALRKMANQLDKQASARVRHADSGRQHKKQKKRGGRPTLTVPRPTVITTVNPISVMSTRDGGLEAHLPSGYTEDTIPKVVKDKLEEMYGPGIRYVYEPGSEPYAGKHAAPAPAEGLPTLEDIRRMRGDDDGHRDL